jgi:hypothetical protein
MSNAFQCSQWFDAIVSYAIIVDVHYNNETCNWVDTGGIYALVLTNNSHCVKCAWLENSFRSKRRLTFGILSIFNKDALVTFELFKSALGLYLFAQTRVVDGCLFEPVDGFLKKTI